MDIARLKNINTKALGYAYEFIRNPVQAPKAIYYLAKGVHLGEFFKLNTPWLRSYSFGTVIDVGANTSQFSSAVSQIFPSANIYAFEPLEACFQTLVKRMSGNNNFEAWCLALGEKTECVTFFSHTFTKSSSLLPMSATHKEAFPWTGKAHEVKVSVECLDNLRPQIEIKRPALLKLDIQGSELFALRGAMKTLRDIDIVITEVSFVKLYENQPLFDEIYSFLKHQGFAYRGGVDIVASPVDGTILQEDALFIRTK